MSVFVYIYSQSNRRRWIREYCLWLPSHTSLLYILADDDDDDDDEDDVDNVDVPNL